MKKITNWYKDLKLRMLQSIGNSIVRSVQKASSSDEAEFWYKTGTSLNDLRAITAVRRAIFACRPIKEPFSLDGFGEEIFGKTI